MLSTRVSGLRQLGRDLEAFGLTVDDLKGAFGAIAAKGAKTAAQLAPRRTGALAGSVRGNRAKSKAVIAAGFARRVEWAGPINYGWPAHNIRGSFFMQRADAKIEPVALSELDKEIDKAIRAKGLD